MFTRLQQLTAQLTMRMTHILGHLSKTALNWKRGLKFMSRACARHSRMCRPIPATASKTLLWPSCHMSRVRPSQAAQQLWKMECLALMIMKSAPMKQVGPVRCKHQRAMHAPHQASQNSWASCASSHDMLNRWRSDIECPVWQVRVLRKQQ